MTLTTLIINSILRNLGKSIGNSLISIMGLHFYRWDPPFSGPDLSFMGLCVVEWWCKEQSFKPYPLVSWLITVSQLTTDKWHVKKKTQALPIFCIFKESMQQKNTTRLMERFLCTLDCLMWYQSSNVLYH